MYLRAYLCVIVCGACMALVVPVYTTAEALSSAVNACIVASPVGACSPAIGTWDVSSVTNMSNLFQNMDSFNTDISLWNVAHVTAMSDMFNGAGAFNKPIGSWNVSQVATMSRMFRSALSFNQDLSVWDVTSVTDFDNTFYATAALKRVLCSVVWLSKIELLAVAFVESGGSVCTALPPPSPPPPPLTPGGAWVIRVRFTLRI